MFCFFFFQAEDGIRDRDVTGVQTCALPILARRPRSHPPPRGGPPPSEGQDPRPARRAAAGACPAAPAARLQSLAGLTAPAGGRGCRSYPCRSEGADVVHT